MTLIHKNKPEFKYGKKITEKNNLKSVFPELAAMWDYNKNDVLPEYVFPRANKSFFWKCKFGHEWEQKLSNLCRHSRACPVCSGKKPNFQKNIKTEFPKIYKEWDFNKNRNIDPLKVAFGSNKKCWWICEFGHSWQARMCSRIKSGYGCKKCKYANKPKVKFKNEHPEFFKEININKNKNLDIENLSISTFKKIWWTCSVCKYDFQTSAKNRRDWHKPGVCSHQVIVNGKEYVPSNSIKYKAPELLKYYDVKKNHPLKPDLVSYHDKSKFWWVCDNGHRYQQTPASKTTILHRDKQINCPECKGRLLTEETKLSNKNKRVCSEWDYSKNKLTPDKIHWKSTNNYWWKCKFGHSWSTSVYHRTKSKSDCPSCKLPSSLPEIRIYSELDKIFSNVRHRFYYNKNFEIDIFLADQKVAIEYDGWYFHKNRYEKDIDKNKKIKDFGLKLIRIREEGLQAIDEHDLYVSKNKLAKEDLNKIIERIEDLGFKSISTAKYKLKNSFINEKLYRKIQFFLPAPPYKESLKAVVPNLSNEFDLIKNAPLKPELFRPNSAKKVWWVCKRKHSWDATIANRNTRKSGCPVCAKSFRDERRKEITNSLKKKFPEITKEWNYLKNDNLRPEFFKPYSRFAAWWTCPKCKKPYKKKISSRTIPVNKGRCVDCFPIYKKLL